MIGWRHLLSLSLLWWAVTGFLPTSHLKVRVLDLSHSKQSEKRSTKLCALHQGVRERIHNYGVACQGLVNITCNGYMVAEQTLPEDITQRFVRQARILSITKRALVVLDALEKNIKICERVVWGQASEEKDKDNAFAFYTKFHLMRAKIEALLNHIYGGKRKSRRKSRP